MSFKNLPDIFYNTEDDVRTLKEDYALLTDAQKSSISHIMKNHIERHKIFLGCENVDVEEDIHDRLIRLREKKGYSVKEMADKIGCCRNTVYNHENTDCDIKVDYIPLYAKNYDVSVDYLVSGKIYGIPDGLVSDFEGLDFKSQTLLAGLLEDLIKEFCDIY